MLPSLDSMNPVTVQGLRSQEYEVWVINDMPKHFSPSVIREAGGAISTSPVSTSSSLSLKSLLKSVKTDEGVASSTKSATATGTYFFCFPFLFVPFALTGFG